MSTTTKIDCDPALFGEGTPQAVEVPSIRLKSKPRRWPFALLAFVVGSVVIGIVIVITELNSSPSARNAGYQFAPGAPKTGPFSSTFTSEPVGRQNPNVPVMQAYSSNSNGWCDGDETICTTITTAKPTETLKKLIAAIPQGKAKQYKVRLSVMPIEEVDDSANK